MRSFVRLMMGIMLLVSAVVHAQGLTSQMSGAVVDSSQAVLRS